MFSSFIFVLSKQTLFVLLKIPHMVTYFVMLYEPNDTLYNLSLLRIGLLHLFLTITHILLTLNHVINFFLYCIAASLFRKYLFKFKYNCMSTISRSREYTDTRGTSGSTLPNIVIHE